MYDPLGQRETRVFTTRISCRYIQAQWSISVESVYPTPLHPSPLTDRPLRICLQAHDNQSPHCMLFKVGGH